MVTLAICSTLIGLALGLRFRFLVLLPFMVVGSALLVAAGCRAGDASTQMILPIAVFACALQIGYLCAALLGPAIAPTYFAGRLSPLGGPKLR